MATLDTLQDAVNVLTTSTTTLVTEVQTKKAVLDAAVDDAQDAQTAAQAARDSAETYKLAAETAATTATSIASGLAGFDLESIAENKSVTAVDVFVYDTSKDSDGGAWRKRTQGTSWYNETLNTATRGSRREFPAVAVIVAEAAKVTIYDGDDPALPMWMVFFGSAGNMLYGGSVSSISAVNGSLLSTSTVYATNWISFVSDDHKQYATAANRPYLGSIEQRNENLGVGVYAAGGIVNNACNDVAMTVLPDAPIDPATGLQVPTIAVATAGGVSVIKDNGTVVDSALTHNTASVTFSGNRLIALSITNNWLRDYGYVGSIASDGFTEDKVYTETTVPALVTPSYTAGYSSKSLVEDYLGQGKGLNSFNVDISNYSKGMVAYTTSTYNTGWMNGNIKGAFLSDTDDTDLVGSAPLEDDFSTYADTAAMKAAGWSSVTSIGTGDISLVSGAMQLDSDGTDNRARGSRPFTTVVGETYLVEYTATQFHHFRVGTSENGTQNLSLLNQPTGANTFTYTFVATATTTYVTWEGFNNAGQEPQIDNVSVKLADADRSVNNKGLIVNGTVTRTAVATGADLVAYSGFSAANYLAQPYNSALDFGTGDFSFMWWTKGTDTNAHFFDRDDVPSAGVQIRSYCSATTWTFNAVVALTITANVQDGSWKHLCVRRESGVLYMYINGALVGSVAHTSNLTNTAANLYVGNTSAGGSPLNDGSLALLRISATAPTAEQIAKIYNDERPLFQENAQATLYGASDAVTALAHDDATDLLHVGTSAGRSVFQGLRRVSNTTTAVGTAISASNGLVVEE